MYFNQWTVTLNVTWQIQQAVTLALKTWTPPQKKKKIVRLSVTQVWIFDLGWRTEKETLKALNMPT